MCFVAVVQQIDFFLNLEINSFIQVYKIRETFIKGKPNTVSQRPCASASQFALVLDTLFFLSFLFHVLISYFNLLHNPVLQRRPFLRRQRHTQPAGSRAKPEAGLQRLLPPARPAEDGASHAGQNPPGGTISHWGGEREPATPLLFHQRGHDQWQVWTFNSTSLQPCWMGGRNWKERLAVF